MSQTNQTPGLFTYRSGTIVLENVTDTIGAEDNALSVHTSGGWKHVLGHADDIKRFYEEFHRHYAAKLTAFATLDEIKRDPQIDDQHDKQFAELLASIKPPQVHVHRVELGGVDLNDMDAVRKAVEMTAAAIELINGEDQGADPALPTRFMQMDIMTDYCSPIRSAVDAGYDLAKVGVKEPLGKGTVRDVLMNLGWHLYHAEALLSKPVEPPRGRWGQEMVSRAEMIELQDKYDRACLERAEAEANLEAADKQLRVYHLRTAEMQASVTAMVDELFNLARPPKKGKKLPVIGVPTVGDTF